MKGETALQAPRILASQQLQPRRGMDLGTTAAIASAAGLPNVSMLAQAFGKLSSPSKTQEQVCSVLMSSLMDTCSVKNCFGVILNGYMQQK
jgi:hypothetical protein